VFDLLVHQSDCAYVSSSTSVSETVHTGDAVVVSTASEPPPV